MPDRTCLDCGVIVAYSRRRCIRHQREWEARRNADPKRQAYRDPAYRAMVPIGLCVECGLRMADTRDHIIPISKGGTNDPSNIRFLCRECNSAKGNR